MGRNITKLCPVFVLGAGMNLRFSIRTTIKEKRPLFQETGRALTTAVLVTSSQAVQHPSDTSSASLLVERRMKNSRGKENSSNKVLVANVLLLT